MTNQATCPACHAVLRSETPLAPGTPIKCPSCQHVFRVGEVVPTAPPGMPPAGIAPPGPPQPYAPPPRRKSRALHIVLWVTLGGGLGLCLCCGGLMLFYQYQTKDDTLLGTWELDAAETAKVNGNPAIEKASVTYEFKGGFPREAVLTEGGTSRKGMWGAQKQGSTETIQFTPEGAVMPQRYDIERTPDDPDHITVTNGPANVPTPFVLKRMK